MEDVGEGFLPMRRKFDGLTEGVDDPAQNEFASHPTTVTFKELLQGDGFLPVTFVGCWLRQHCVDGFQKMSAKGLHTAFAALS